MQEESNGELAFFCTFLSEAMGFFWHYHVRNQVTQNNTLTIILTLSNFNERGLFSFFARAYSIIIDKEDS